jgi:hypothetical protein
LTVTDCISDPPLSATLTKPDVISDVLFPISLNWIQRRRSVDECDA